MLKRHPRGFAVLTATDIDDEGRQWIEVMPVGEKLRNGPWYFTIRTDDLEIYAQSIRDRPGMIPVDYDHEGAKDEGSTRAAGWFTGEAKVEGDRLLAEVQWTPKAQQEIADGEFRFISPEFDFEQRDAKTGLLTKAKEIIAATLTNRPFFRELAPVGSEVVWAPGEGFEALRERLYAELNPGGMEHARYWVMDIAAGRALVREYDSQLTWIVTFTATENDIEVADRRDWTAAEQEWVAAAHDAARANTTRRPFRPQERNQGETMPDFKTIAAALGLAGDADEKTILDKLTETKTLSETLASENADLKAAASTKGEEPTKIEQLHAELVVERTKRITGERDTVLAQAVREGRIYPAQKDSLIAAFGGTAPTEDTVSALKAFIESTPADSVPLKARGHGGEGKPADTVGDTGESERLSYRVGAAEFKPDPDSLALHAKAVAALKASGKERYTEDEYVTALEHAQRA